MVQTDKDQKMSLDLNISMYSLTKPLSQFLDEVSKIKDNHLKLSEIDGYVGKLEEEKKKIEVFKRELPLCMLLLNEAIGTLKEEARLETDNKKNWMSSAQLWISNSNTNLKSVNKEEAPLSLMNPRSNMLMDCSRIEKNQLQFNKTLQSHNIQKKEMRRRWSQDLHRKFVDALHRLGGSQVATPKQIRDLMKVDGLTNDEVKSHLQKYRMHIRKHPPKTLSSLDQPGLLDNETQSLINLSRSDSPRSHSSEEEEKSDGRCWKNESKKKRQELDLEL